MSIMKKLACCIAVAGGMLCSAGDFTLTSHDDSFSVDFRGKTIIASSEFTLNGQPIFQAGELTAESKTLDDGGAALNIWSQDPARRFRQEAVISADGNRVEINMQFDYQAYSFEEDKIVGYVLRVPFERLDGVEFDGITGRSFKTVEIHDKVPAKFGNLAPDRMRMFAPKLAEGDLLFDFDARGVCTYSDVTCNTIVSQWQVTHSDNNPDFMQFIASVPIHSYGGGISAKLVLTAGGLKEFRKYHVRTNYSYYDAMPAQKLYSFGATTVGSRYTKLDLTKALDEQDGWIEQADAQIITGTNTGAFYSAVAGTQPAKLKVQGLSPGFYFVTAGIGNFDGAGNNFDIAVNGETLAENIEVNAGDAASITRVFKLETGDAEISFNGNWRISTLGFQHLLSLYEDFSFERGFWVTQGFEPSVMYRYQDFATPPKFVTGRTDFHLPDQALSQPKPRSLVYDKAMLSPDAQKAMAWRYQAVIGEFGPANDGTFQEFNGPGLLERRMESAKADNLNVIIISGLLARHDYPNHLDFVRKMLARITEEAHKKDIRIMDHIDFVLLWNKDAGFRVAAEHPDWLARELTTMLPSTDFCFNNHSRNAAFHEFFKKWIADTGIDGMMVDEANFTGANFCGCGDCRRDFTNDTGCEWPANELAEEQVDEKGKLSSTALAKIFRTWRTKRVGDWWVSLRHAIEKDYPAFCFLCYTTHYGLTDGYAANHYGADLMQVGLAVDFLGTEIMSRNVWASYRSIFAYRKAKNLFHLACDAPIFGCVYSPGGWDVAYAGWALNNMNGQITWAEALRCPEGASNFYLFGDRNMDLTRVKSEADVAILFSSQGRNNGLRMNYRQELFGIAQMLGDMHVNYDIISDKSLSAEMLASYKLLFVAASAPLSDDQIKVIRDFSERGGHVILGPIAAIADEYSNMREEWPFADLFGFEPSERASKVSELALDNGETLQPAENIPAFLPNPRDMKMQPSSVTMVWGKTRIPAIFSAPLGDGKVKFMPLAIASQTVQEECTPPRKFDYEKDPATYRAFEYLLADIIKDANAGTWQCQAPEQVLATLYRDGKQLYAHFFNATGVKLKKDDVVPVYIPDGAFPHPKEDIVFTLPDASLSVAEAASPDFDGWKELVLEKDENGVKVILPKELLTVYTMVRVR